MIITDSMAAPICPKNCRIVSDHSPASADDCEALSSENNDTRPKITSTIAANSSIQAGRSCSNLPSRSGSSQGWNSMSSFGVRRDEGAGGGGGISFLTSCGELAGFPERLLEGRELDELPVAPGAEPDGLDVVRALPDDLDFEVEDFDDFESAITLDLVSNRKCRTEVSE